MRLTIEGLANIKIDDLNSRHEFALKSAVNKTTTFARTFIKDQINREVNFPNGYTNPNQGRLTEKLSSKGDYVGFVAGRGRRTSLARFASGSNGNITLNVGFKRENIKSKRIFRIKLNRGDDTDNFNMGLAIRMRKGEKFTGKKKPLNMQDRGLYILYGPSIAQAMEAIIKKPNFEPAIVEKFDSEYMRVINGSF